VLPAASRLRDPELFRQCLRRGRRTGSRTLVLHRLGSETAAGQEPIGTPEARVGLVVSKAVGPAVTRNRVKRRLRASVRELLGQLDPADILVIRATPAAATASYAELSHDLGRCVQKVMSA
jgi:ribonuclease P protein component